MVQSDGKIIVSIKFSYHRGISSYDWNNCNICVILLKFMVLLSCLSDVFDFIWRYMTLVRKKGLY